MMNMCRRKRKVCVAQKKLQMSDSFCLMTQIIIHLQIFLLNNDFLSSVVYPVCTCFIVDLKLGRVRQPHTES